MNNAKAGLESILKTELPGYAVETQTVATIAGIVYYRKHRLAKKKSKKEDESARSAKDKPTVTSPEEGSESLGQEPATTETPERVGRISLASIMD